MSEEAQKLKDQGNALYAKKQYMEAASKYSDAILLDKNNAILYANRSACRLNMNQYFDALADGHRATEIAPNYPKAWFRCGSAYEALKQYPGSVAMYERTLKVLSSLPSSSTTDLEIKKQCEARLMLSRRALAEPPTMSEDACPTDPRKGLFPWEVAEKILKAGISTKHSSTWSIHFANKEFVKGVQGLQAIRRVPYTTSEGKAGYQRMANTAALSDISNAILRDSRVFRIEINDFLERLTDQAKHETNHWNGWPGNIGPETLQEKAQERLRKEGWDSVRPALATLIRYWVVMGFIVGKTASNYTSAMEYHRNALNIINWGRQVWKDIPKDKRGTIFEPTFRRGVWNMYLDTLMAAHSLDTKNSELLEKIFKEADALIRDVDDHPYKPEEYPLNYDPGFVLSFFNNIKGNALACKGLYHSYMGEHGADRSVDAVEDHFVSAMESYLNAADCLPDDDLNHPWYLNCAYNFMQVAAAPTSIILDVLARIRLSVPKMREVWCQNSSMAMVPKRQDIVYAKLLRIEERTKSLVTQKSCG